MAHHVRIVKIPLLTREGNPRPGKYRYEARCKHRMCRQQPVGVATSEVRARMLPSEHFLSVKMAHEAAHPNDLAFRRANRNKTKKAEKMVNLRG